MDCAAVLSKMPLFSAKKTPIIVYLTNLNCSRPPRRHVIFLSQSERHQGPIDSAEQGLGAFVAALEVEMGTVVAERAIEAQLHGAELGLPTGLIELDVSGADHVDIVGAPSLDFGDPPTAEGVGRTRLGQAAVTRSLGRRIRLQATAVSVTTQPTRANPRCRVLRNPAAVLIQPNGSSMRFRRRWLIA